MIIRNDTDKRVSIVINGARLSVEAEGTTTVTDEQAAAWIAVHSFLKVSDSIVTEPVVELAEKVPVEEEKPKKKPKKK